MNPYSKMYYTGAQEVLRQETQDYSGQTVVSDKRYTITSPSGLLAETTDPHYLSQQKFHVSHYAYDNFYRQITQATYTTSSGDPNSVTNTNVFTQTTYNTPSTDAIYNPGFTTVTDQTGKFTKKTINAAGQVTNKQNSSPSTQQNATYAFNSNAQPKSITLTTPSNPSQTIIYTYDYNGLGQNIKTMDPSLGTTTYTYSTLGEILQKVSIDGTINYTYDVFGRTLTKTGQVSGASTYIYVTSGYGTEQLKSVTGPNDLTEYKYDSYDRMIEDKKTLNLGGKVLTTNHVFDMYGRETQHTYPGGMVVKKQYNSLSDLTAIVDINNASIWQFNVKDAKGRITKFTQGNGIVTQSVYDDMDYLTEIDYGGGTIHQQLYTYNELAGNLTTRVFNNFVDNTSLKEVFNFDILDRLTQSKQLDINNNQIQVNNVGFDILGNILNKSDAASFQYNSPNNPYFITGASGIQGNISLNTLGVSYNEFAKSSQLSEMSTNKQLNIIYDTDDNRIRSDYAISGVNQYSRYYAENYDRQETSIGYKEWSYIMAPSGFCASYYNNNGTKELDYALTDNLGSPVLITSSNSTPSILEEYSFDSWGRRRNPINWSYASVPVPTHLIRGYTLHEHFDDFYVINMNSRIYDPVMGRFVQPDDHVTDDDNLQTYNLYAYCKNNPLRYTDPSGHDDMPVLTFDEMFNNTEVLDQWYGSVAMFAGEVSNSDPLLAQYFPASYAGFSNSNSIDLGGEAVNITFNVSDMNIVAYQDMYFSGHSIVQEDDGRSFQNICETCRDNSTIGDNLFGLSYAGANNPNTYENKADFSYVPTSAADYAAIGHDRRYLNLGINGLSGLVTDPRAIGADWQFANEEMTTALLPSTNPVDKLYAVTLGVGLAFAALPKTIFALSSPFGYNEISWWYNYSNNGVTNVPTPIKR